MTNGNDSRLWLLAVPALLTLMALAGCASVACRVLRLIPSPPDNPNLN
jgi:hypothetical protein